MSLTSNVELARLDSKNIERCVNVLFFTSHPKLSHIERTVEHAQELKMGLGILCF